MPQQCDVCGARNDTVTPCKPVKANLCLPCFQDESVTAESIAAGVHSGNGVVQAGDPVRIVTAEDFAAVHEPGADPIAGEDGEVLIPEDGDIMIYGDGGASKTTLGIDLAVHLAAGDDWLGASVPRPVRVALIEAEGPRPLFRRKLRNKLDAWHGGAVGDRLHVLETPWGEFRFPDAEEVADALGQLQVDVLIVGPLTRVGMEELGTLQQVRDFMALIAAFRRRTCRRLVIILIHHENKGGAVSGAWEGAGDTLLHTEVKARGKTTLTVQKARWSGEWHKRKLELGWTDGEGFEVIDEGERHLESEIGRHLAERPWRTAKEISRKEEAGGIGANVDTVKGVLEVSERFVSRTGEAAKAVGRNPTAVVWNLTEKVTRALSHPESPSVLGGGDGQGDSGDSHVSESPSPESPPPGALTADSAAESPEASSGART